MTERFGIRSLRKQFATDDVCLEYLFKQQYSKRCRCGGTFVRMIGKHKYHCTRCARQVSPMAGTIFEKTRIPLTLWFHALMMFSNAKSGLSAKTIQRDLEITYKCAWRMAHRIRGILVQSEETLKGKVEIDLGYFGGKGKAGKDNVNLSKVFQSKTKVLAAIERDGEARARVVSSGSAKNHKLFLWQNVSTINTQLMTDKTLHLDKGAKPYDRHSVHHRNKEYVRDDAHTNTVDAFWSHMKGSIRGSHKNVSPKYLQSYIDGFVFHYNHRGSDRKRFFALLGLILRKPE